MQQRDGHRHLRFRTRDWQRLRGTPDICKTWMSQDRMFAEVAKQAASPRACCFIVALLTDAQAGIQERYHFLQRPPRTQLMDSDTPRPLDSPPLAKV